MAATEYKMRGEKLTKSTHLHYAESNIVNEWKVRKAGGGGGDHRKHYATQFLFLPKWNFSYQFENSYDDFGSFKGLKKDPKGNLPTHRNSRQNKRGQT